jgi:hypothetical protein
MLDLWNQESLIHERTVEAPVFMPALMSPSHVYPTDTVSLTVVRVYKKTMTYNGIRWELAVLDKEEQYVMDVLVF